MERDIQVDTPAPHVATSPTSVLPPGSDTVQDAPKERSAVKFASSSVPGKFERISELVSLIKDVGPWFYATGGGLLYVCGFIVVNANLAKVGVLDIEFANATYFTAGLSFFLYLLVFYMFAGRAIIFGKSWMAKEIKEHLQNGGGQRWLPIIFVHSLINLIFFCCFSATVFAASAFKESPSGWFYGSLVVPFGLLYTMDITNLDVKYPKCHDVILIISKLAAISGFFIGTIKAQSALILFLQYVGFVAIINFVLDWFERRKTNPEHLSFTAVWGFTALIGAAATYGMTVFGEVNPRLGGARPEAVQLALKQEARDVLAASLHPELLPPRVEGKLVHQTPSFLYLAMPNRTLRLKAEDVVIVISKAPQEGGAVDDLIHNLKASTGAAK